MPIVNSIVSFIRTTVMLPNTLVHAFEQFDDAFASLEQYALLTKHGEITGQTAAVLNVSLRRVDRGFRIASTQLGLEQFDTTPRSARLVTSVSMEDIKEKMEKGKDFIKSLIAKLMEFLRSVSRLATDVISGMSNKLSAYKERIKNITEENPSQIEYTVKGAGKLYSGREFVGQDLTPAKRLVEWLKNKYGPNLLKLFDEIYHTLNTYDFTTGNIDEYKQQLNSEIEERTVNLGTIPWVDGKDIKVVDGFKLTFIASSPYPTDELDVPVRKKNELVQFVDQASSIASDLSEFSRIDNKITKAMDDLAQLETRTAETIEASMLQMQCEVYTLQATQRLVQTGLPSVYSAIDKALSDKLALVDTELGFYKQEKEAA